MFVEKFGCVTSLVHNLADKIVSPKITINLYAYVQTTSRPKLFRNFFVKLFSITNCMKTNSPNVLFNHRAILLLEKTSQVMKQKLLLILMLVSFYSISFAQSARSSQNGTIAVTELNSILPQNGTVSARVASTTAGTVNVERLRDLITQVQSATYYFDGEVKTYGEMPTNLFMDLSSLNQINSAIALKDNIEIATININTASELNSTIDLAAFSNFPNLKYIYFISNVTTTSENIASRITNYESRFNIVYKIDKGDRNQ